MVRREVIGYCALVVGGLTATFAGGTYAVGEWHRQEARRSWEAVEARAIVAFARRSAVLEAGLSFPKAVGAPVARIRIPRLYLDEIVLEGVDDNSLNAGPGHLPGSAYPGETGNSVISAHRDRHFAKLGDIAIGDTIVTETGADALRWVVTSKRIVAANAPALFRTSDATLTLTTCWPIRYFGTAPDRLIVTARPL